MNTTTTSPESTSTGHMPPNSLLDTAQPLTLDNELLGIYLADHHAGSVGGLELGRRAASSNKGTPLGRFLVEFVSDLENDQEALERCMELVGASRAPAKDAAAWIAAKAGSLKRNGRWVERSPMTNVVELEGLIAGSRARVSLFRTLADLRLDPKDAQHVEARVERGRAHLRALEAFRSEAARTAFIKS